MQDRVPDKSVLGCYELQRTLAKGSYSTVYQARHTHPGLQGRLVSLKVVRDSRFVPHFIQSVRSHASLLTHPRIPDLHQVSGTDDLMYSARKFIEGESLHTFISTAQGNAASLTTIIADIAYALDHAHEQGVVHGLVHPRHILLDKDGSAWLIGFGEYPPLGDGMILGNPSHLAPEQFETTEVLTAATDVYALCETAIWLLSGRHPFSGCTIHNLSEAKRRDKVALRLTELLPDLSPKLEAVLKQGLAVKPADRFSKASEFATALKTAVSATGKRRWWSWQ
jgi:serine/threonine protein kinase